ncbi:S1-like domain-containing RNA-binding protein [Ruficoccus sp. ZRK36]|uniref:CvfB family protein n=1 Tax=Ruficoccus sp. ZRK36 TaxID=2866311 RepID=UPI001C73D05E|nr:S1-like domain-containing RNA-binding protein [Ruficoccus sp. ZRK36]QYY35013.1 hypothetical protein K0V07_11960 [Ruficoccus sp. ZRK36]
MLRLGEFHKLIIDRDVEPGLYLRNDDGDEVLLPGKDMPKSFQLGEVIEVFVYLDHKERPIATTRQPLIQTGRFAYLQCTSTTGIGAFVDWGMDKELLVPFANQEESMRKGNSYIVYMGVDEVTGRLVGYTKLNKFLRCEKSNLKRYEQVDLLVSHFTDLGANVIVNDRHRGMIFNNSIFEEIHVGDRMKGYVKNVRADGKLDIVLQPEGERGVADSTALVYAAIEKNGGVLPLHDKSSAEDIYDALGISKKVFKRAVSALYKERRIELNKDSISITGGTA